MEQLAISLAYRYAAICVMLSEANFCAERLHLDEHLPLSWTDVRQSYVAPPRLLNSLGAIDTDSFSYGFAPSGRLVFVTRIHPFGQEDFPQVQRALSRIDATITTNKAYELATNWLAACSVDVAKLQRSFPPEVHQQFLFVKGGRKALLPIFDVTWPRPPPATPAVIVTIYGPKSELIQLRQNDELFSARAPARVTDRETLLRIHDEEFARYTTAQRSNLVNRCTSLSDK
jgi:hypothetical protein